MAPADFRVSTGELETLASQLSALAGELAQATSMAPDAGAAGHPDLVTAISDFAAHWTGEVQKAEDLLSKFGQRLSGAGTAYDAADASAAGSFTGG